MQTPDLKFRILLQEALVRNLERSPFRVDSSAARRKLANLYLEGGRNPDGSTKSPFGQVPEGLRVGIGMSEAMKPIRYGFTFSTPNPPENINSPPLVTKRKAETAQFEKSAQGFDDLTSGFSIVPNVSRLSQQVREEGPSTLNGVPLPTPSKTQIRTSRPGTLEYGMAQVMNANPKLVGNDRDLVRAWLDVKYREKGWLSAGEIKAAAALSKNPQALQRLRIIQANEFPEHGLTADKEYKLHVDDHMYGPGGRLRIPPEYAGEPASARREAEEDLNSQQHSRDELSQLRRRWEAYLLKEQGRKVPMSPLRWMRPDELSKWSDDQEQGIANIISPVTDQLQGIIPGTDTFQRMLHANPKILPVFRAFAEKEDPGTLRGKLARMAAGQMQQVYDGKVFTQFVAGVLNTPFDIAADLAIIVVPDSTAFQRVGAVTNIVLKLGPEKVFGLTAKLRAFKGAGKLPAEFQALPTTWRPRLGKLEEPMPVPQVLVQIHRQQILFESLRLTCRMKLQLRAPNREPEFLMTQGRPARYIKSY
jgi:hypothetical protein